MRYLLILIVGLAVAVFTALNPTIKDLFSSQDQESEAEILYWVAPMDANYRRDKAGKSPMGMDLVPVYVQQKKAEPKILYWVAPMDANYRRDKPGQSPMGMDLVPVYEQEESVQEGLVKISPSVENNLGVRTALVKKENFELAINTLGTVQANEESIWQINSRVSGWVEKLYVKSTGTEVKKGEPLFALYSPELVKAQESLFNALKLNRKLLISSSKARLQVLGVSKRQIKKIIKSKKVLQNIVIYAPHKGTISELNLNEGAFISPAIRVIKAVDLDSVWVDVELFSSQLSLIKLGDKASMKLDYFPGQQWSGSVDFIYPEMNINNRTLRVRLQFDNPDALLKPNMFASLQLTPQMQQKRLLIPREAVIYAGKMDRVVLALGDGRFKSVLVTLGLENKKSVEVLSGLTEGQKVVTSAQFLLDSESSISADFERMLEVQNREQNEPVYDPDIADDDLDWLDFSLLDGSQNNFILAAKEVSL